MQMIFSTLLTSTLIENTNATPPNQVGQGIHPTQKSARILNVQYQTRFRGQKNNKFRLITTFICCLESRQVARILMCVVEETDIMYEIQGLARKPTFIPWAGS